MSKPGRNDPCPCGSGLKYKKCCLDSQTQANTTAVAAVPSALGQRMRQTNTVLSETLAEHMLTHYTPDAFAQGWDEFSNWDDVPLSPDDYPEIDSAFMPWFVYNWVPDNAEAEEEDWQPEMTIAEHYLQTMGNRISAFEKRFIEAACAQQFSYWQVLAVEPGHSVTLRDIMRGHEITVPDRFISTMISPADVLFAMIITIDGESMLLGTGPYPLPASCANDLMDFREKIACAEFEASQALPQGAPVLTTELLHEYDFELRDYYWKAREMILNPAPPKLQNTDGEDMVPTTLHYQLLCSPIQALTALASLSLDSVDTLLQDGQTNAAGELVAIEFPWLKKGNAQHAGWQNTVMGHMRIDGHSLTVEVNSRERANSIKRRIAQRLKKQASFVKSETETIEEMMAKRQADPNNQQWLAQQTADNEALMALPEVQAQLAAMTANHWNQWLDTALPALNGQTPRQAARSTAGRERLEALLLEFAQKSRGDPLLDPDIDMLRRELKL